MIDPAAKKRFDHLMETDPLFRERTLRFGAALFHSLCQGAVRTGKVSLRGKSREEAFQLLLEYVSVAGDQEMSFVIDHCAEVLAEARAATSHSKSIVAVICYATYFEHVLNRIIIAASERYGIEDAIAYRLLRTASISDKTGDLIRELRLPAMEDRTSKYIRAIADIRNELVHYKWISRSHKELHEHEKRISQALKHAEEAVQHLKAYESQSLLEGLEDLFESENA